MSASTPMDSIQGVHPTVFANAPSPAIPAKPQIGQQGEEELQSFLQQWQGQLQGQDLGPDVSGYLTNVFQGFGLGSNNNLQELVRQLFGAGNIA